MVKLWSLKKFDVSANREKMLIKLCAGYIVEVNSHLKTATRETLKLASVKECQNT